MKGKSLFSSLSVLVLIAASVTFGMILAGILDIGSNGTAGPSPQKTLSDNHALSGKLDFTAVADIISPAVVSIRSTHIEKISAHPYADQDIFRWFFGPDRENDKEDKERKTLTGGSGFIISSDGYVVTNFHVIEEAEEIEVIFNSERSEPIVAEIIGTDPATDLALLKVNAKDDLPYLILGDSDALQVGEWVVAAGYPLRYGYTITAGVVSAMGKQLGLADISLESFIQTDAAINFGNSGGPLVNSRGEVVGVNTAIAARGQSIGFAVPINQFKRIQNQLKEHGKVERGYLGVKIRAIDLDRQKAFDLPGLDGAFVEEVEPDTPAEDAGIEHGDVILKVDDLVIRDTDELISYVSALEPGTTVKVTVLREGKEKILKVKLGKRPGIKDEEPEKPDRDKGDVNEKLGLTIKELNSELRRIYGIDRGVDGLLITHVDTISPAADEGLRTGDVIMEVNRTPLSSADQFEKIVSKLEKGDRLALYIYRPGRKPIKFFAIIRIDE